MSAVSSAIDYFIDLTNEQRRKRRDNPLATQILDWVIDVSALLGALLVLFMAVSIGANVLLRRVFSAPLEWALPMTEFALLWITFMAAPVVLRREGHVRMTAVTESLSARPRLWLYIIGSVIGALVCAILAWQTFDTTLGQFQSGAVLLQGIEVKRWLVTWVIPYGFLLLTLQFTRMGYNAFRLKSYEPAVEHEVEIEEGAV